MGCFEFPKLSTQPGLAHGVFTRHGGVSEGPYRSLNCSFMVGDRPDCVSRNLAIIQGHMGAERLVAMKQVHGSRVSWIRDVASDGGDHPESDALITNVPRTAMLVKMADCQAVMLFDPRHRAAANVHCGWKGNVSNILARCVGEMVSVFGSRPAEMLGAVGPSLGPCCAEFTTHEEIFPPSFRRFMVRENHFDLWALSVHQLTEAGMERENIELANVCTRCRADLFFSHRGEGETGRFAAVIMINSLE